MPDFYTVLEFNEEINTSCQVGDTVYFVTHNPSYVGSGIASSGNLTPKIVGTVVQLISAEQNPFPSNVIPLSYITTPVVKSIRVKLQGQNAYTAQQNIPDIDDFIMFGKDCVNLSGLLGYYAKVDFLNASPEKATLYSVGSEVAGSSQ